VSYRVLLTSEAEKQLHEGNEWWRENRPAAPDLLLQEFERVLNLLREMPGLGAPFRRTKVPGVRRFLLRRSGCWVYYVADEPRALVYVVAVWGGRRGTEPPLPVP
jgi:plasmid stabilization system protein ParE